MRCRESLGLAPTATNIKHAKKIREDVVSSIRTGRFDYQDYFPNSGSARKRGWIKDTSFVSVRAGMSRVAERNKINMQPSGQYAAERIIERELLPEFGDLDANFVTRESIQDYIAKCGKRGLSPATIREYLKPLKAYLEICEADGIIERNPMTLPGGKSAITLPADNTREPEPFTPAELDKIWAQCEGVYLNLFQFSVATGLRPSELIALKWSDVTWESSDEYPLGSIWICKAKSRFNGTKGTKTKAGTRRVRLFKPARDALEAQKRHTWFKQDLIFVNRYGDQFESSMTLVKMWKKVLPKAKVAWRPMYQLRHTYASILLSIGESPAWIAQQMGHKNSIVMYERYGRLISQFANNGDRGAEAFAKLARRAS